MGFCIYCNQNVVSDTSCPKCYRTITNKNDKKPFGSIFAAPQKKVNQTDKWQDTYSKKAIFTHDSAAIKTKQTRKMPQFTNTEVTTVMKMCLNCKEKKETSKLGALSTTFYCNSCLTEKLTCPACQQHFTESENRTQYNQHVYHTACFKCNQCKSSLNPIFTVLDNDGNPSCRVCQFKNNNEQTSFGSSMSTPLRTSLVASRSTLTNGTKSIMDSPLYTKYQQQRRASALDAQNTIRQEQELRMSQRDLASRSTSLIPTDTLLRKLSRDITPNAEPQPEPSKSTAIAPRRKRVVKRPCKECGLHVSKKDYRGLRVQPDQVICFHKNCLFCAKCHQNFNSLEFCTDGKKFYHTECSNIQTPSLSRQGTPVSEEEEEFPQTPPPQNTFFDIVSDSPTLVEPLDTFPHPAKKEATSETEVTEISCNACGMTVTDTYLELANNVYHKECLLCAGCNKTVPTERQLVKHQDKIYCDHCIPPSQETTTTKKPSAPTDLKITINPDLPKRNPTVTTPSDIFKSRKKVLPRLGGVRTCARCNESMPFSDTQPGPNASRWHKKCLRCAGCNKQMDSAAHMTVNKETGLCLVHCRGCLDDTPAPRFVRKV